MVLRMSLRGCLHVACKGMELTLLLVRLHLQALLSTSFLLANTLPRSSHPPHSFARDANRAFILAWSKLQ